MEERTRLQRHQSSNSDPVSIFAPRSTDRSSEVMRSPGALPAIGHDFSRISILPMQAKLSVSQPNDPYEQEADRVAGEVMQMQISESNQTKIDRQCAECEEEEERVQRKSIVQRFSNSPSQAGEDLEHRLNSSKGGGSPLPEEVRSFMEPRFGANFSQVRVHTDSEAVQMNQALGAEAFTHGNDIYFGNGKLPANSNLTAHELTHVVQQTGADDRPQSPESIRKRSLISTLDHNSSISRQEADASLGTSASPTWVPPTNDIRTVKVWINAFIPGDVPGKTVPSPTGGTMLHGPIPGISDCFQTDNRTFSSDIHAASRMHSEVEIDLTGAEPSIVSEWHHCSATHEIDCEDGEVECEAHGDTSKMSFTELQVRSESELSIKVQGAANNPCFGGSPDIDFSGTIFVNHSTRTVVFVGFIDEFPAFEMYATANGGAGVELFSRMPLPGKDPGNLFGGANRLQIGSTTI